MLAVPDPIFHHTIAQITGSSSKSSKSAMPSTLPPSQMSPVKPNVSITPMSSRTTPATSANTGSSGSSNGDGKTKRSGIRLVLHLTTK